MANGYEAPAELRELEKMLSTFVYNNGYDMTQVFDHWLEYIIGFFSTEGNPIPNWRYNQEQNKFFYSLVVEWIQVMEKKIAVKSWYDAFGTLYESLIISNSKKKGFAQFFTPPEICDLMTQIKGNTEELQGKRSGVSDPSCGSGRNLLAFHVHAPGNIMYAEDIDRTSCMMTVCNFLIHGCVGEVVWHDSLNPDTWYGGWIVNYGLNNPFRKYFGIPHVSELTKENSFIYQSWQQKKKEFEEKKAAEVKVEIKPTQPVQLSFAFD